ncbi:hypothetical protein BDV19DRAFT_361267 [Aspergillus venezuelensis]
MFGYGFDDGKHQSGEDDIVLEMEACVSLLFLSSLLLLFFLPPSNQYMFRVDFSRPLLDPYVEYNKIGLERYARGYLDAERQGNGVAIGYDLRRVEAVGDRGAVANIQTASNGCFH